MTIELTAVDRDQENSPSHWQQFGFAYGALLFVLAGWLIAFFLIPYYKPDDTKAGQFGDMFGAVNALFSGLAFAGIIATILLQRRELELQRKELKDTREEMRGSKEQLRRQGDALTKQNFESTFFEMVSLHHDLVNSLHYGAGGLQGRRALGNLYEAYRNTRGQTRSLEEAYKRFFESNEPYLGHYFRNLYHIVKLVDRSNVEDRSVYIGIIVAQLSKFELLLLFYNCLSDHGEAFKPYVEQYGMLENMAQGGLYSQDDIRLYDKKAFGENAPKD